MTVKLVDLSLEDYTDRYVMEFVIFRPLEKMPPIPAVGQPMVITQAKVQLQKAALGLLTNTATDITYFPPNKPKWPAPSPAHLPDASYTTSTSRKPMSKDVQTYVAMLQNKIREDAVPTKIEYETSLSLASNLKEKFSELKDVAPGKFHDLLGQVVSIYRANGQLVTVYLTDYTVNDYFYDNQIINGDVDSEEADDPYGYLAGKKIKPQKTNDGKEWAGPSGKMSIQITAWDQQGDYCEEYVNSQDWVMMRNVQIKISQKTGCLEGVLRNDQKYPQKIQTQVLQMPQSAEDVDPRWKNAIRRMREYEKLHKHEQKYGPAAAAAEARNKRKAEIEVKPPNAKKRREEKRKAAELKARQDAEKAKHKDVFTEEPKQLSIRLNELVKTKTSSEPAARDPVTLTDILHFRPTIKLEDGTPITPPFTSSKYRSYVRVTDFFPHNIADFSVGKKASLYDALSDASSSEDSEDDDLNRRGDMTDYVNRYEGQWNWKWKFMIQVEDARQPDENKTKTKTRIWLGVDNDSGQFLLNSDACNLRADKAALSQIKERLFILWGDLEERKSEFLASEEGRILSSRTFAVDTGTPPPELTISSTFQSSQSSPVHGKKKSKLGQMPADSDDEEQSSAQFATQQSIPHPPSPPSNPNSPTKLKKLRPKEAGEKLAEKLKEIGEEAQNKPFEACIREWGVEAEAGKYRRAWGLCDTIIKY